MSQGIALVTGANRGIGKEVSRQLAQKGYTVLVTARSVQKAQECVASLKVKDLHPAQLDVRDLESINRLQKQVNRQFGRLDVLINNAAINYDTWQRAVSADLAVVQDTFETNTYGPWRMVQAFLFLLRQSQHARIVNVSSESGSLADMGAGTPAYSISKVALNGLTRMLADELRHERILVNAICPGWIATDMGGPGGGPVENGARGIVWAATLPDNGPTGGFFRDGQPLKW